MPMSKLFTAFIFIFCTLTSLASAAGGDCTLSPSPVFLRLSNCTIAPNNDLPDGVDSWGLQLSLASPAQELCFNPSMTVNNTVVMTKQICTNDNSSTYAQCISRRGGVFNEQEATSGFTSSQGGLAPDPVWDSFNPAFAGSANASIQFPSDVSLPSYPIALADLAPNSSVGQLGLANDSVFLHELVSAGFSSVPAFSLLAGSQSVQQPRDGHLIIGGYDAASLAGPFWNFSISDTTTAGSRVCSLQVEVDSLILSRPGHTDVELNTGGTPMISCIEPLDRLFRFPENVLDFFQQNTGWQNDPSLVSNQLYIVEPGLTYNSSFNGTLRFTLKNGPVVEIPTGELAQPLRGIDQTGKRVLQNNVTVVNIFNDSAPEGTAVLGGVFLSQVYLTVNYPLEQFQLAPAVTETAGALDLRPFDNANTINCTPLPRDNAYIGVTVLGCVIAVVLIILCIYFFKKRKQEKAKEKARTTAPKYDSDNGSHAPPPGETQFVTDVPKELPDVRSYRIGSLASESTDEAYPRRDRQESTISTAISQYRPEPPRFPNIFTYIPELDPEGEPHELGDGEPPGPQEGDLSPLSDRVLD